MVILGFDIGAAFTPDVSILETVVRGLITYFSIFLLLRVVLNGEVSVINVPDHEAQRHDWTVIPKTGDI